jgi:asparagine synthase (glutamine-hydrolysing)
MFRYVGFDWNPSAPAQAAFAQRLDETIRRAQGWQPALSGPGLRVHATGTRPGVNRTYPLARDQGVILGRLFRRTEPPSGPRAFEISSSETERILKTDGQALVDDYWGPYIAILRPRGRSTRLLRDPGGTLPCYRCDVEGVAVFFSWLEDLIAFATPWTPRVDWRAVAARLSLGRLGGRETALQDVSQVLPGQLTTLDGQATSLWSAVAIARTPIDPGPDVATARLKRVTTDCVHAWSACHEAILLRLSGGLDSAILLGCLATAPTAARITCLNYHSPGADSDERSYARLAAAKAGVELVERERVAGFRLEKVLEGSCTPTPESYIGRMGTGRIDAEVAASHAAQAIFTGLGGDQVFFQFRCTWPAADYLRAHGPGVGFLRASLDAARLGRTSLLHSMRRALADRRHRGALEGAEPSLLLARRGTAPGARELARYVHPELHRAADLPIGKFRQVQELINPFGYYDPFLREAAPELVNPLLSQPLVELCLALPSWLLTQGGRGRALARRAFAHDIPREIATRQSKGGMEEHVALILRRNLAFARGLLLDGQLVREGILDRNQVESALAGRLSATGTLSALHDAIAVEAWLRRVTASSGPMAA